MKPQEPSQNFKTKVPLSGGRGGAEGAGGRKWDLGAWHGDHWKGHSFQVGFALCGPAEDRGRQHYSCSQR